MLEQFHDIADQIITQQVISGNVYRHLQDQTALTPFGQLAHRLFDHPVGQQVNASGTLGEDDEFSGRDITELRMSPAQQRLGLTHIALTNIQLGLVMQHQFAILRGFAQITNERDLSLVGQVTSILIDLQATGKERGVLAGNYRTVEQFLGGVTVLRVHRDTNAAFKLQLMIVDTLRLTQQPLHSVSHAHRASAGRVVQQQQKLIGPQSRHGIASAQITLQALAHLSQQLVHAFGAHAFADRGEVLDTQR